VHLDPLGEFVNGNQQVGVAPSALRKGPSPHTTKGYVTGIIWRV
jgi:hypothetical protein